MSFAGLDRTVAGVDGCRGGWIAAVVEPGGDPAATVHARFQDLLDALPGDALVAVDMPIGFLDRNGPDGRGPEPVVRRLLRPFQSSVFPVPSRRSVYSWEGPVPSRRELPDVHALATRIARETSDPPKGVSRQTLCIMPKMREVDGLLRASRDLRDRVFESHPEVAFWMMNGQRTLSARKKIGGRIDPSGMKLRRKLLAASGLPPGFLDRAPRSRAREDDFLDACAMLVVAARHARGETMSFPQARKVDSHGIEIAIWA